MLSGRGGEVELHQTKRRKLHGPIRGVVFTHPRVKGDIKCVPLLLGPILDLVQVILRDVAREARMRFTILRP